MPILRPRIALTGDLFQSREGNFPCSGQHLAFVQSILDQDGWPLILPVRAGLPQARLHEEAYELLSSMDGLLVAGEGDVDPLQVQLPWEVALCRVAVQQLSLPVLGVGRGMQLLNLALTPSEVGSLSKNGVISIAEMLAHLSFRPSFRHAGNGDGVYAGAHSFHPVQLTPPLSTYLGTTYLRVQSLHACTIEPLAPGLEICALSPEGVPEGVVLQKDTFCLGVQFSPPEQLFEIFLNESRCRAHAQAESEVVTTRGG